MSENIAIIEAAEAVRVAAAKPCSFECWYDGSAFHPEQRDPVTGKLPKAGARA